MKPASTEFYDRLAEEVTDLCRLWRVTARNRATLYYTDSVNDITYDGHVYKASEAFWSSAIENALGGARGNMEITVAFGSEITRPDCERGIYDGAEVLVDLIFYDHIDLGVMPLYVGTIHGVTLPHKTTAVFSVEGSSARMSRGLTEEFSPTCRAVFCDERCTLNLASFGTNFTVASASERTFAATQLDATPAGHFNLGTVTWLTGDNAGVSIEVQTGGDGAARLYMPLPFAMQVGDTGTIYRGCPKTLAACNSYNNVLNFRGEPYMPGSDFVVAPTNYDPPDDDGGRPPDLPDGWSPVS